ncbi:MAG: TIGR02466 family protein [Cyanobacteriota bacterium]
MDPRLTITSLFPLAIARVPLPIDPLDTAVLMQEILWLRDQARSNPDPGCAWTGDLQGVWQFHRHPACAWLKQQVARQSLAYLRSVGFDTDRVALHVQRCWPVVSEPGQVVGRHHHPNAHLSAVFYLNGDGSGRSGCLRLYPRQSCNELVPGLAVGHGGPIAPVHPLNSPWWDLAPEAGLLVLFPSSTDHAVLVNDDEDSRFSISFDLVLTAPSPVHDLDAPPEYLSPHPSGWDALAAAPEGDQA